MSKLIFKGKPDRNKINSQSTDSSKQANKPYNFLKQASQKQI
jgi:hypothetical protein